MDALVLEATGGAQAAAASGSSVLDLDTYLPARLMILSNKLSRGASNLYRQHFGVGINEWRVLSYLAGESWIAASRICQMVGLDKAAVSRSLSFLDQRGLVDSRTPGGDARRRLYSLTASGRLLHDRAMVVALERERRLVSCLTLEEQATLLALLNRLHGNLGSVDRPYDVPPGPHTATGD
ncbi:MarR family winged helix-turn-helix transcriptional regulator [Roseomonas sp. NAR14]|uniref:MarR family winged helix-turn-helix transcriptional regulator n=1 Tax=Roseomonas acroporae TaxID=2937791 RepID=A0A9X1YCN4_9PROT|nr:MarR family winged helix-turn-helix transcriptional regulator [Roseomonas acroporae]MCK8787713.1 MarR family winged helix-turn-helix transcriptional regulator [Roseomonas acroporae]